MVKLTLILCVTVTQGKQNVSHKTRKEKNPVTIVPSPINNPDPILITDTSFFNGREHCPRYDEIYHIFHTEDFPFDDEEIDAYHNIRKSGIHTIATHPYVVPIQ
jgi:hypothetical protein